MANRVGICCDKTKLFSFAIWPIFNLIFNLFWLDRYGPWPFIIVCCGMLYFIFGLHYIASIRNISISRCLWLILEFVLLLNMLTITFVIEYDQNWWYHFVAIPSFAVYAVFNFPFSKYCVSSRWKNHMLNDDICAFLISGPEGGPKSPNESLQDRYYCVLHSTLRGDSSPNFIVESNASDYHLLEVDSDAAHCKQQQSDYILNSMKCYKLQHGI